MTVSPEIINAYISRGWGLCSIPDGAKTPTAPGWQLCPVNDPAVFASGCAVGLLMGPLSGGLICVDLDFDSNDTEAWAAADELLPPTDLVDGRPGKGTAHRIYKITDAEFADSVLPGPTAASRMAMDAGKLPRFPGTKRFSNANGRGIDFLGAGAQVVIPPSRHKSGSTREWFGGDPGEPATVKYAVLRASVVALADRLGCHRPPVERDLEHAQEPDPAALASTPVRDRITRASAYLRQAQPLHHGANLGFHSQQFRIACALCELGLPIEDAWPLYRSWNAGSSTPDDDHTNRATLDNAYRSAVFGSKVVLHRLPDEAKEAPAVPIDLKRFTDKPQRLPQIILPSVGPNDGTVTLNDCAFQLFSLIAQSRSLYIRNCVVHELRPTSQGPVLYAIRPHDLVALVQRHAELWTWRALSNGTAALKPKATLSVDTAAALLVTPESREILPPISTILAQPGLIEVDGDLRSLNPGYNIEAGGVLVTGGSIIPQVPLVEAIADLADLFYDFDFITPGDRARALSALITPAMRLAGLIPGHVPALIIEADNSQAGKGFLATVIAAIYGERQSIVAQRQGGVGSLDESISQRLIEGRPFIMLDNLRGRIDSMQLEAFLTPTGLFNARVPHRGDVPVDPTRHLFTFTSNGAAMTVDLANRSCVVRLRKRPRMHSWRQWPVESGGLLDYIHECQPHLLGCVHSVVRAWWDAGRPRASDGGHSFREWSSIMAWIVTNLFKAGTLLDGHDVVQQRMADPSQGWLRDVAILVQKHKDPKESWTASDLAMLCQNFGLTVPGANPDTGIESLARTIGMVMNRVFTSAGGECILNDGNRIERTSTWDSDKSRNRHEYRFAIPIPPNTPRE